MLKKLDPETCTSFLRHFRDCKPSRTLLPILSLGPGEIPTYATNCTGYQYGNVFCSKRPCWCTNVGMVWLRLTCRLTACQPHHTTVA